MIRILATIAVGAVLGLGFGQLQSRLATSGYEERFAGAGHVGRNSRRKNEAKWLMNMKKLGQFELGCSVEPNSNLGQIMQHGESMSHLFVFATFETAHQFYMGSLICSLEWSYKLNYPIARVSR